MVGVIDKWQKCKFWGKNRPTSDPSREGGELAGAQLSSDSEALSLTGEWEEGLLPPLKKKQLPLRKKAITLKEKGNYP